MATTSAPPPAPPAPDPDPAPPFAWYAPFLVGIAVYIGLGVAVAIVGVAAGWTTGDIPDRAVIGATFVQDAVLIAAAFGVAALTSRRVRWDLGVRRVRPGRSLLLAGAAFMLFFVFLLIWQSVLDVSQKDDLAQELGAHDSSVNLVAVAILVALVAPVAEELFFRGFMFGALRGAIGWVKGAIVTGLVFGLIHAGGTDVVFLLPLAVLGFLLCVLYRRTGSLLPGMGVHAFNNALALASTMHWTAAQGLAAVVAAPAVVVTVMALVGVPRFPVPPDRRDDAAPPVPAPAPASAAPPAFLPPVPPDGR